MAQLRALAVRLAFMTLIGAAGCGDGGTAPGVADEGEEDADVPPDGEDGGESDAGDDDGGEQDAGTARDGSTADASGQDAEAVDGGSGDGSIIDASDISECEGDLLEFNGARSIGRPFSAGVSASAAHLVYVVPSGGGTSGNNTAQGLRYVTFGTTGDVSTPVDVVNVGIDTYDRTRDPSLVVGDTKIELFYTSNSAGPYELFYKDLTGTAAPSRETTNTRNEYALAAGSFGGSAAVVYSNEPTTANPAGALALKLPGQPAIELVAESAGYHAAQVAFSDVGDTGQRRGVAAFLSDLSAKSGLFAQPLDVNGMPNGALVTLSSQIGGASSVDVARGQDGKGGLIYTEAPAAGIHQLRFRNVNTDGTIGTTVRSLTTGNQDLRDISISAYSHGYVIAYRRVGGLPNAAASIYLLFVDAEGNRSGTRLVRSAAASGGGLKVLVANDGRFLVLWADTESVTNEATKQTEIALKVRVARLNCTL
jgi:hypothetical protein